MCRRKFKPFNELCLEDRNLVASKFEGTDFKRQRTERIPALRTIWLMVPEGKRAKQIMQAQQMLENFGQGKLDEIVSTEIPMSFLLEAC